MRREFPKSVRREADTRSAGICECHRIPGWNGCGQPLGRSNRYYEHIVQAGIKDDASLDNCAVLTKTCWKRKTVTVDITTVAKVKRVGEKDRGIRGRSRNPMPGNRDSNIKITMNRGAVDRRTGEPLGRRT